MSDLDSALADYKANQAEYTQQMKNQKPWAQVIDEARTSSGMKQAEETLGVLNKRTIETENLLNKLEGDINTRISGMGASMSLRNRLYATEERPMKQTLVDLMQAGKVATSQYQTSKSVFDRLFQGEQLQRESDKEAREFNLSNLLQTYNSLADIEKERIAAQAKIQAANISASSRKKSGGGGSDSVSTTNYTTTIMGADGKPHNVRITSNSKTGQKIAQEDLGVSGSAWKDIAAEGTEDAIIKLFD